MDTCKPNPCTSSSTLNTKFEACGFGYQVVSIVDKFTKSPVIYRGANVSKTFLESLIEEERQIKEILKIVVPLQMTSENERDFQKTSICHICKGYVDKKDMASTVTSSVKVSVYSKIMKSSVFQVIWKHISFSLGNLRFIDSFQFMSQSLENLTENLAQEGLQKNKQVCF